MNELQDIRGLQEVSWFPLAFGWWVVIAAILILIIVMIVLIYYRRRRVTQSIPWQTLAMQEWSLFQQVSLPRRKEIVQLAELLRRIAIQRHGREACASLVGTQWLDWLSHHDPQQFDWQTMKQLLIELPYLPEEQEIDPHQFKRLLIAVQHWIQA